MNRRLRKKKHVGEFQEWGCRLVITRNRKEDFDGFLDAFIEEAVEANNCYCGAVGCEDKLDAVVELGRLTESPESKLQQILQWLDARNDVAEYKTGPLKDVWYDEFEEGIETKIEQAAPADAEQAC